MENKMTKQEICEMFEMTLSNTNEHHPARLWEIICWENDIDDDNEEVGEIYDEWFEKTL